MEETELRFLGESLMKRMYKEEGVYEGWMCICGSGGDGWGSFNI
ncbi:hypothetical protein [Staphylococcus warneri]|nr:hypothetical protein [Staphylococcus warneri]